MSTGSLFIISAPSGTGKTTILKEVMADIAALSFSVSHTTRAPRQGEENGIDYHFVDRDTFIKTRDQHGFLEWAEVHGNLYGTSITAVEESLALGIDIILDIDVQGARQIRAKTDTAATHIFISPPSWQELAKRLSGRGTDSQETIDLRLQNARAEVADIDSYDFVIVNDKIEKAATMLRAIILAARARTRRAMDGSTLPVLNP